MSERMHADDLAVLVAATLAAPLANDEGGGTAGVILFYRQILTQLRHEGSIRRDSHGGTGD